MSELPLPVWADKDTPDFHMYEDATAYKDFGDTVQVMPVTQETLRYAAALNQVRQPLHDALRHTQLPADLRFYVRPIQSRISGHTGAPAFPGQRIAMSDQLESMPAYSEAQNAGFIGVGGMAGGYEPALGIIRIDTEQLKAEHPIDVLSTVAQGLGSAAINGVADAYRNQDTGRITIETGAVWRYQGRSYGELIHGAAVAKLAALTRRHLNLVLPPADSGAKSMLVPYRKYGGMSAQDVMAASLDVVNRAAGFPQEDPGIYRPLWQFARNGRDPAARAEAAAIIRYAARATGSESWFTLEKLEAAQPDLSTSLAVLSQAEEACGMDTSERPSRSLQRVS